MARHYDAHVRLRIYVLLLVFFAVNVGSALAQSQARLTDAVNPFIGTGGHGHTYPGPSLPFGMIQPGPDTRLTGWDGCSGYHYSDSRLYGFSHTHLSGTGIPDYTDILLMPMTGEPRLNNGADGQPGYSSTFSHADETARPGYYAVTLHDHNIRVELTTTLRVGMHRYTLPAGAPAHVILDLEHRDRAPRGVDRRRVGSRSERRAALAQLGARPGRVLRDQVFAAVRRGIRYQRQAATRRSISGTVANRCR